MHAVITADLVRNLKTFPTKWSENAEPTFVIEKQF